MLSTFSRLKAVQDLNFPAQITEPNALARLQKRPLYGLSFELKATRFLIGCSVRKKIEKEIMRLDCSFYSSSDGGFDCHADDGGGDAGVSVVVVIVVVDNDGDNSNCGNDCSDDGDGVDDDDSLGLGEVTNR
ncbi:unnamed protein product [Hydatigera taeniaeformis]|uniref:Uncharacterized protein n=1 Tax=Hydatigena taeniaeformis TaxID=6205 RepID=A0A0R3X782_HYDTA|nr:unnamed protein product [Hydatigera taeniaeformis]